MTEEERRSLKRGDIIRHVNRSESLVVLSNENGKVSAGRVWDVSNPDEWVKIRMETELRLGRTIEVPLQLRDQHCRFPRR